MSEVQQRNLEPDENLHFVGVFCADGIDFPSNGDAEKTKKCFIKTCLPM